VSGEEKVFQDGRARKLGIEEDAARAEITMG